MLKSYCCPVAVMLQYSVRVVSMSCQSHVEVVKVVSKQVEAVSKPCQSRVEAVLKLEDMLKLFEAVS